jgi:negative regulator of flagellin synthesis FlgM
MKIESSNKPAGTPLTREVRSQAPGKPDKLSGSEVQLSGLSAQMRAMDDEPSFDATRVAEIKQAISEGRFTINSGAIADRLIASARELLDFKPQV